MQLDGHTCERTLSAHLIHFRSPRLRPLSDLGALTRCENRRICPSSSLRCLDGTRLLDTLGLDEALEVVDDIGPFEGMARGDRCCWAARYATR